VSDSDPHLRRGRLLLIAAALLWSTSGVVLKSPPLVNWDLPLEMRGPILACYRAAFALLFLLPFVRWKRVRWRPAILPMALCFGAMNLLYITALTRTTAAAAIFLQYTASIWAFVFGWLFLKERIDRGNLLALLLAVAGIAWIVAGDWGGPNAVGNVMALGAGLSYAGVILCLRQLRDEDSAWLIAVDHAVSFVILLPWVAIATSQGSSENPGMSSGLDAVQWSLVAALGVTSMALPYVIFARAIRHVPTQEAGLLLLLEPILNPVWVWLAWGEENPPQIWIGGGLILSGLAVRYLLIPASRALRRREA
jgi:drug/metabolite transporter, DME family